MLAVRFVCASESFTFLSREKHCRLVETRWIDSTRSVECPDLRATKMTTTNHIIIYLPNQKVFKDRVNSLTHQKNKIKERKKKNGTEVVGTNYSLNLWAVTHVKVN